MAVAIWHGNVNIGLDINSFKGKFYVKSQHTSFLSYLDSSRYVPRSLVAVQ